MSLESPPRLKNDSELGPMLRAADEAAMTPARIAANGAAVKATIAGGLALGSPLLKITLFVALLVGGGVVVQRQLASHESPASSTPDPAVAPAVVKPAAIVEPAVVEPAAVVEAATVVEPTLPAVVEPAAVVEPKAPAPVEPKPTAVVTPKPPAVVEPKPTAVVAPKPPAPPPAPVAPAAVVAVTPAPAPSPPPRRTVAPPRRTVAPSQTPAPVAPAATVAVTPAQAPSRTPPSISAMHNDEWTDKIDTRPQSPAPPRTEPPPPSDLPEQIKLYEAARTAKTKKRFALGLQHLDELLRRFPSTPLRADVDLTRAELLMLSDRLGDAATALETLATAPAHSGRRGELLRTLGDVRRKQNDCPRAIDAYARARAAGLSAQETIRVDRGIERCMVTP